MAKVALKDWKEQIRDPKIECMSRDEMAALQSRRLVEVVNRVSIRTSGCSTGKDRQSAGNIRNNR